MDRGNGIFVYSPTVEDQPPAQAPAQPPEAQPQQPVSLVCTLVSLAWCAAYANLPARF